MVDKQRRRNSAGKRRYHRLVFNFIDLKSCSNLAFFVFRKERRRVEPTYSKTSELSALPKEVPIDWFDPVYWNTVLTVRDKLQYLSGGIRIALPAVQHCDTWEKCAEWKNLPRNEFFDKYIEEVLKDYNIPTEEEVEQFEDWEEVARREQEEQQEWRPAAHSPINDQDLYGSD